MGARPYSEWASAAEAAADRARREILPRFRDVQVEIKPDGSPVTQADREAERVIRETLRATTPDFGLLGEELGSEIEGDRPYWVIDPIDGTLAFSRGIPLFSTLIALVVEGEPVVGLIDLPALGERYVGWKGGGCRRNGVKVSVSVETSLDQAIISHGDPFAFERFGKRHVFESLASRLPMLRGYTDAFGHAMVLGGGVGAMVDLELNPWDVAATQVLVPEAGGRCVTIAPGKSALSQDKVGLVLGNAALVDQLLPIVEDAGPSE